MLVNELELLKMVMSFFGVGRLTIRQDGTAHYEVTDNLLNVIIPHFDKYPLRGTKYFDFCSFKKAIDIFVSQNHRTEQGLSELDKIHNSMNSYRKLSASSYIQPAHLIEGNKAYIPINGHYINGFLAGDGSIGLSLTSTKFCSMNLSFSQHVLNRPLMESIANYFQSPTKIYPHGPNSIQITLRGNKLWENIIFKHFSEYPLYGSKTERLGKLFAIKEFLASDDYLMKVGRARQ